LAALGKLNPIAAAILHNLGSLLVVFNSARLVREGEEAGVEVKAVTPVVGDAEATPNSHCVTMNLLWQTSRAEVQQPFLALRAGAVGTRDPRRRVGERIRAERHSFSEL
jgi:hypothetical protein